LSRTFHKTPPKSIHPSSLLTNSAEGLRSLKNRITLVTKLPTTAQGLAATNKLVEQVIFLVDNLSGKKFRPEVTKKLKATRADAVTRFTKSLAVLEDTPSQQDIAQKKRAERERAEKERVGKLSAEEQRKYVERERKGKTQSYPPQNHD
jgi:transaldolase